MIYIKNSQRSVAVNTDALRKETQILLDYLQLDAYDLSIWVTNDRTIRLFNKQFRNKDKATDILSFGGIEYVESEGLFDENPSLGDLIISAPFVLRMLPELGCSLDERMRVLLVHGITHLLGYDHENDPDWERMQKKERELLEVISSIVEEKVAT